MSYTLRCPNCGSRLPVNMTALNESKTQARQLLLGFGIGAFMGRAGLGDYAGDVASALLDNQHSTLGGKFLCPNCMHTWYAKSYQAPVTEYRYMIVPEGRFSFDMIAWLERIRKNASAPIAETISAQTLVVKYAQTTDISDTSTVDKLFSSLKKVQTLSNDEQKPVLKDLYCRMIVNFVLLMDAKTQLVANPNRKEARKSLAKAGEMLAESIKDLSLLSGGATEASFSKMGNINFFAPENETSGINSFIRCLINQNEAEDAVDEAEEAFYTTLDGIFTRLEENRKSIGPSRYISSMIDKYAPALHLYLDDSIVGRQEAFLKAERLQDSRKGTLIAMGIIAAVIGVILYIAYYISDDASIWLWYFIITGGVMALVYALFDSAINNAFGHVKTMLEENQNRIYKIKETGRKFSLKNGKKIDSEAVPEPADGSFLSEPIEEETEFIPYEDEVEVEADPEAEAESEVDTEADAEAEAEAQYKDFYMELVADGELSERDLRMLDKYREKCGLSEERARELEAELYYPEITDDEQEYLDLFREYAADGEISVRDRSLLNKLRDRMGISEERAAELESMK